MEFKLWLAYCAYCIKYGIKEIKSFGEFVGTKDHPLIEDLKTGL